MSHNVESGLLHFALFLPYMSFVYSLKLLVLCFYGILMCVSVCVSVPLYVSHAFSLVFFLLFILSYSELFIFVLSHFILLLFFKLLFHKER